MHDKTIKLWNIDGTQLRTLKGHSAGIWGVSFSPDSSFDAYGKITGAVLSSDGQAITIAIANVDKLAQLWY